MRVLVLHTVAPERAAAGRTVGEFDLNAAAEGIAEALPCAVVAGVRGEPLEVMEQITSHRPDVVFNLCEAPMGRTELESHAAALLEWMGVRFTGSRSATLELCRRKDRVNAVLSASGVCVPRSGMFPCIVKPADEDGSAGIHCGSICDNDMEMEAAVRRLNGRAIVEEFLAGREFAVSLWGAREPEFVSFGEFVFQNGLRLNTYAAKWDIASDDFANSPLHYDTDVDPALREAIVAAAREAWRAVAAYGYLRVDIRLDSAGTPRVLDVNPNPELGPGVGINRAVQEAGWAWERFVEQQVAWAF